MSGSIYKSPEGEREILALYDSALSELKPAHGSLTLDTSHGRSHVLTLGPEEAPPLLLLPGGNFLNPTCCSWLSSLADEHRVYAPDIPGQPGYSAHSPRLSTKDDSQARWLVEIMYSLEIERAPVVGVSYGAGLALRLAGYAPERISRMILLMPSGLVSGSLPGMVYSIVVPMLLYRLRPSRERLSKAVSPLLTEEDDALARQIGAVYRQVRLDTNLPRLATVKELEEFHAPVLVFAGEDDPFFPGEAVVRRAEEVIPNLRAAESIEGARHIPSSAMFVRINDEIRAFLSNSERLTGSS